MEEEDPVWVTVAQWRRRPFTHLLALMIGALGPMEIVVEMLTTHSPGNAGMAAVLLITTLTCGAIVSFFGGPWKSTPLVWEETSISTAQVELPAPASDPKTGWITILGTVWAAWALGLFGIVLLVLSTNLFDQFDLLEHYPFLMFGLLMPGTWIVSLAPDWLAHLAPPSVRSVSQTIELEGRTLTVGGKRFHIGRSEQQVRLRKGRHEAELTLSNDAERIVLCGNVEDLERVAQWVQNQGKTGGRAEVPQQLATLRE